MSCAVTQTLRTRSWKVSVRESSQWVSARLACGVGLAAPPAALASGTPCADARLRASCRNRLRLCDSAKAELSAFTERLFRAAKTRIREHLLPAQLRHIVGTAHVLEERAKQGLEVRILLDNTTVDMHLCTGGKPAVRSEVLPAGGALAAD